MDEWYGGIYWKSIYYTIFYISVLLYILSFFTTNATSLIITEIANILLGTGIIFEICLYGGNFPTNVYTYSIPFGLMLGVIVYTVILLTTNQDVISNGHISSVYFTFINISSMLVLIQLYIFLKNKKDKIDRLTPAVSSTMGLIGVLNILCIITVYVLLTYFRTDG